MAIGPIRGTTTNYSFDKINFDFPRWHQYVNDNWDSIDAAIKAVSDAFQDFLVEFNEVISETNTARDEAVAAKEAAEISENNAAGSASAASTSAGNAATSESNAAASEASAAGSAGAASTSAANALASEEEATDQAEIAITAAATLSGAVDTINEVEARHWVEEEFILTTAYAAGARVRVNEDDFIIGPSYQDQINDLYDITEEQGERPYRTTEFILNTTYATGTNVLIDEDDKIKSVSGSGGGGTDPGPDPNTSLNGPARTYDYRSYDPGSTPDVLIGSSNRNAINLAARAALGRPVLYMIFQFGQSLAVGGVSSGAALINGTPIYPNNVLMFNNGLRNLQSAGTSFVAAVDGPVSGDSGDTGLVACMNRLYELCKLSHPSMDPMFLGVVQGAGGTALDNMQRGSSRGRYLPFHVAAAKKICDQLGWDLVVMGVRLIHGNANYELSSFGRYYGMRKTWDAQLIEDMRYNNNQQLDDILVWADQPDSYSTLANLGIGAIYNGVIEAQNARQMYGPNIRPLFGHTHAPRDGGGEGPTHPSNLVYTQIGDGGAYDMFESYFGTGRPPFMPRHCYLVADDTIEFVVDVPKPPLFIGDPNGNVVPLGDGGKGLAIIDHYTLSKIAIDTVTIEDPGTISWPGTSLFEVTPARVRVKADTSLVNKTTTLCNAMLGDTGQTKDGPKYGARTEFFDSLDEVAYWGTDGLVASGANNFYLNRPMERWALPVRK